MSQALKRRLLWIIFLAAALIAIGFFFIPAVVIRPFAYQSPRGLVLAMALRSRAPWVTLIAASVALLAAFQLWSGARWWTRTALVLAILPVGFSTVMARLNYFEWMFHPVDVAQFDSAASSKLAANEMVLTVRFGNDARAYPISQMAYHHILNDVVGGVPIATY